MEGILLRVNLQYLIFAGISNFFIFMYFLKPIAILYFVRISVDNACIRDYSTYPSCMTPANQSNSNTILMFQCPTQQCICYVTRYVILQLYWVGHWNINVILLLLYVCWDRFRNLKSRQLWLISRFAGQSDTFFCKITSF